MAILIVFEEQKVINLQKNLKWEKTNDQRLLSVRRYRHDLGVRLRTSQCSDARINTSHLVNSSYLSHLGTKGQVSSGAIRDIRDGRMIRVIFDSDHSKKLRLSHAIIQWREVGSSGGGGNRKLFFVLRWTRNTAFCRDSRCLNGVTNNLSHVMVSTSLQLTAARWPPLVTFTLVILYFILDSRGPCYGFMPWLQMIFSCSLLSSESFRWKTKQSPLL